MNLGGGNSGGHDRAGSDSSSSSGGEEVVVSSSGQQGSRLGGDGGPPLTTADGAETSPSGAVQEDAARTAGRGFLMITGAKGWFMVMGAAVSIGLPMLMSTEQFGIYSIVLNAVSLVNMVVVTGALQAVSKLISERPERGLSVVRQAVVLQCLVGLPLGLGYIVGAPWIAWLFNDPSLTPLLRLSGGVLLAYAFYAIFVGYFNGLKAFGRQAMLDVGFATLKTLLILGAVVAGLGVYGAVGGFVVAAVVIAVVAAALVGAHASGRGGTRFWQRGIDDPEQGDALRRLGLYLVLVMVYTFGINGVLRADLFVLKSMLAGATTQVGLNSDMVSGVYAAMLNLARLPYQAVVAVTFVVFPMISRATFESDTEATRGYIEGTLRYAFLLLMLLGVLIAGNAEELVLGLFGAAFGDGVMPLMVLSLATIGFALFFIATTMITGAGHPGVSVVLALVMMGLTAVLNITLVGGALANEGPIAAVALMNMAAGATATAMVVGCGLAVGYLVWRFEAGLPWSTLLRGTLAAGLVLAVSLGVPLPLDEVGRVSLLAVATVKGALGAALFMGCLAVGREFGPEDTRRLMRVVRRKRRAA